MRTRVITVAKTTPKARVTAMGLSQAAWALRSKSSGSRPKNVVREVSTMARNRVDPASSIAALHSRPSARFRLARSRSTRASLITTPVSASMPIVEKEDS